MRKRMEYIATKMHASKFWGSLYEILKSFHIILVVQSIFDFFEMIFPTEEMKITKEIYTDNHTKLRSARSSLSDERSKEVFDNIIQFRMTKNRKFLKNIMWEDNVYFPLIKGWFPLTEYETFVDCGAYDGDTIREFIKKVHGKYQKIIAFEPDPINVDKIEKYCKYENLSCITIISKGVMDKSGEAAFDNTGTATSKVTEQGNLNIQVMSIDECIECHDASFIKMDIEGSERFALKGAKNTIRNNKPRLAISAYHKPEDIYEILLDIQELCPEYHFYLRHHSYAINETVLYAMVDMQDEYLKDGV